jgi:hypothetical protein
MNHWLNLLLCVLCAQSLVGGSPLGLHSPRPTPAPVSGSGENFPPPEDEVSPAQEQAMWEDIQRNVKIFRSAGILLAPEAVQAVTYTFPLRLAPGLPDVDGFRVSAFTDHNPASGQVLDYNGGSRTYDGHRGTDYALWPFSWNKLDAGEMQVVAAAAGTIVSSANVDPTDHNCSSSTDPWNYVALVHADGRMTIYGHLRYNSLTGKGAGESVAQGEYLGTAASSGNSSGPHLHFEVRFGSFSNAEWMDPYAGPSSQPGSLWSNQRPYYDSAINKLSTHQSPPSTPDPCLPSIPNLQDSFTTPARIYFYAFYRDFQGAFPTQLKIYRPDGSLYNSWQYAPGGTTFSSAWSQGWVFDFTASDPAGTWRFEATYNSQVYETYFNLNAPPTIQIQSPNGGEQLHRQETYPVAWADNFGGSVNIGLYHNGIYDAPIAYNTPSDGEYSWVIDPAQAVGPGYTIRVSSVINPAILDASNAPFTISAAPAVIARNDFVLTPMSTPVTIYVLENDEAPEGSTLSVTAVGTPGSGTVTNDGSVLVYTPDHDFLGSDTFSYTISTGTEISEATVTVWVVAEVFRSFLPQIRR